MDLLVVFLILCTLVGQIKPYTLPEFFAENDHVDVMKIPSDVALADTTDKSDLMYEAFSAIKHAIG